MPQTTTLRRVSTLVVGALFAVVFICSGVSAAQAAGTRGPVAVGVHTATSKAVIRAATVTHHGLKHMALAPLHLASTGPAVAGNSPAFAIATTGETPTAHNSPTLFTTSERAPPAR